MATINPATFLGRATEIGTVEPGKVADLVLLSADPLKDIHSTTQIQSVWLKGKYYDKPALTEMAEKVKTAAKR
jgi:imidazolonepropionase-like amidohydrolase